MGDPVTIHSQEEHFRAHESAKRHLLGFPSAVMAQKGGLNNPLPSKSLITTLHHLSRLAVLHRKGQPHASSHIENELRSVALRTTVKDPNRHSRARLAYGLSPKSSFSPCALLLFLLLFPLLTPLLCALPAPASSFPTTRPLSFTPPLSRFLSSELLLDSWRGCMDGGDGWGRIIPGRGGMAFSSMEAPGKTRRACSSARHF
jgi:hypothetical protein